ncbi:formate dehydrogenase subunit gamma [Shewanella sp. NFH-SH190041]|uniref:formate dehydrogenase subunit gamma n=1 Tax=Shewanella sp. NFH-SH190041 TaxID=2950245 RepID=UPI0021C35E85|nr:formate dehydrogenase subunit gamma [Shewanella sp. NFH-SH190041]BDM63748.1 formate dehydrogenase subunit gamma [Shewanella sp. NFH-SH190041]
MNKLFKLLGLTMALFFAAMSFANAAEPAPTGEPGNAQLWAELHAGATGFTVSQSEFHKQPINVYDLHVLDFRAHWLAPGLVLALFGMITLFIVFIKINGISKVHNGFSGKMVYRWSKADLFSHWLGAIPCLLLILTGLVILAGRFFVKPYLDQGVWGSLVYAAKFTHNTVALPFFFGWALMTLRWAKKQLPKSYDLKWFMMAGGYINFGPFKGKHPDSGFANAGEKLWFWTFALFGLVIAVTGMILLFPNLLHPSRTVSLYALILHGISAIILCAFAVVHIFMATAMSEGGMECMLSGYCDENWATQHHNLWFDEIKANGTLKYRE